jgi:hypothetical protein
MPIQSRRTLLATAIIWAFLLFFNVLLLLLHPDSSSNIKFIRYALIAYSVFALLRIYRAHAHNRQIAAKLLADQFTLYSTDHDYQPVDLTGFPNLDPNFYADYQKQLSAQDLHLVADIEDVTLSGVYPALRTCMRLMADSEGSLTACLAYLNKDLQVVELETELSDANFLRTGFQQTTPIQPFPGIHSAQIPWADGIPALVSTHRQRLQSYLTDHPNVVPIKVTTLQQIIDQQHRQQRLKNAIKADQRFLTREDLQRVANAKPDRQQAAEVLADHVESLQRR